MRRRRNKRQQLIDRGLQIQGYQNCKLFVQQLTGVCRIQDLPSKPYNKRTLKIGDILAWWNGLHYAVYLGNDDVMEVEEWGESPRISRLQDVIAEHDMPEYQYTIPKQNPRTTKLVPKEKVRMKGFSQAKTKIVQPEIPYVLALIEQIVGRSILFPTPIRPMTKAEFQHGRSVVDSGHPMGAGHGQYDSVDKEVAINGNMEPFDLITNVFHENLHHARPDLSEEVVRDTTGEAMLHLYGEYNLGRPYAEERETRKNPETRDSEGRLIPQKYLSGYKGSALKKRIEEIEDRRNEYEDALSKYKDEDKFPKRVRSRLYRPFETDKGKKSKKSNYTKEAHNRGFTGDLKKKQRSASHYYGGTIPLKVLKTIMDRGRAAWASGGHRAGQTPESWGYARVNSFLVGGKTFWTADADQILKLPDGVAMNIANQSVFSSSLSVLWA